MASDPVSSNLSLIEMATGTASGQWGTVLNANMIALLPNLVLKMGFETGLKEGALQRLTHLSRLLDDRLNVVPIAVPPLRARRLRPSTVRSVVMPAITGRPSSRVPEASTAA